MLAIKSVYRLKNKCQYAITAIKNLCKIYIFVRSACLKIAFVRLIFSSKSSVPLGWPNGQTGEIGQISQTILEVRSISV